MNQKLIKNQPEKFLELFVLELFIMNKTIKQMLIFAAIIFISFFVLDYVFAVFAPFIISLVLASLIEPLVTRISLSEKIPLGRTAAVILALIVVLAVFTGFLILGSSRIYFELNRIIQHLPDYETLGQQLRIPEASWQEILQENFNVSPAIVSAIEDNLQSIFDAARGLLMQGAQIVLNTLGSLPLALMILLLSIVATFFMSRDKEKINAAIIKLFPEEWETRVRSIQSELANSAIGYIRALLILITISGLIAFLGLLILGSEYALTLGLMAAILDLIPIIGPALIFYPWMVVSLLLGNFAFAIGLLITHLVLVAVRSSIEPKIMGDNIGIHPLSIMIALFAGYRILGMMGFIVGPTILILIKTAARANLIPFWEARL